MTEEWEVVQFVDQVTGIAYRRYSYKRKPCKRVLLDSRFAKQLAGWAQIDKDLRSVAVWLAEIEKRHVPSPSIKSASFRQSPDRETYNLVKGLFVAALTFYGKCFSKCEGRPVKLERAQLNERFHPVHDEFISYRHNFAAHSGKERIESCEVALVFPKKPKSGVSPKIYTELNQPDLTWPAASSKATFGELVNHARSVAQGKIEWLSTKILNDEVLPYGHEFWSKK